MRLKWGLGDFVRIGAGYTPYPLEVGVVLKPQSSKTLVLIRGEKKEYPNEGLEYVRPQDVDGVGANIGESQEFVEGAFDEETEIYEPPRDSEPSFMDKAKEYAKEIASFVGVAIVIVLAVLFYDKKETVSINKEIDKEIASNNTKISELYDLKKEFSYDIDKTITELKNKNVKLMKGKVELSN